MRAGARYVRLEWPIAPEELPSRLEAALGLGRNSWPVDVARRLADVFLEQIENRKRSAAHEVRWLNLGGFCLRPGFGYIGDEYRIEQVRRIYAGGPQFANQAQNEIDWWIFWGRLAGGLNRNQQIGYRAAAAAVSASEAGQKAAALNNSLLREMWRTASSMELIPAGNRMQLGDALLKAAERRLRALVPLAARRAAACSMVRRIRCSRPRSHRAGSKPCSPVPKADDALVSLARRTGDPVRDVSAATFEAVRARLADSPMLAQLNGETERDESALGRIYGEDLPSGLVLGNS